MKKVDLIVDLQFGSTGKGLIAGYLAEKNGYDVVINANMPNAGHTYINDDGREWIHKVLPNGIVSPNLRAVMIGAGSVFSLDRLEKEIADSADLLQKAVILIHPNAVPLKPSHFQDEQNSGMHDKMGSTAQGSGAALAEKIARPVGTPVIASQDPSFMAWSNRIFHAHNVLVGVCTTIEWCAYLETAESILAEGAQGFSLGVSEQFYPYCTSRDCTPARFMADMGIPLPFLRDVIGTARCHPIRVAGESGGHYDDQTELSWEQLGQEPEKTTVTKKVRRVFSFSEQQIRDAIFACQPTQIFLNFCNYLEPAGYNDIISTIEIALDHHSLVEGKIAYLGHGAKRGDVQPFTAPESTEGPKGKATYAMKPKA